MQGTEVQGFEIHMGKSEPRENNPVFELSGSSSDRGIYTEGDIDRSGLIFGTYMHGLFNSPDFTSKLIDNLCSIGI